MRVVSFKLVKSRTQINFILLHNNSIWRKYPTINSGRRQLKSLWVYIWTHLQQQPWKENIRIINITELKHLRKYEFLSKKRTNTQIKVCLEVSDIEIVESEQMKERKEGKSKSFRIELKKTIIVGEIILWKSSYWRRWWDKEGKK